MLYLKLVKVVIFGHRSGPAVIVLAFRKKEKINVLRTRKGAHRVRQRLCSVWGPAVSAGSWYSLDLINFSTQLAIRWKKRLRAVLNIFCSYLTKKMCISAATSSQSNTSSVSNHLFTLQTESGTRLVMLGKTMQNENVKKSTFLFPGFPTMVTVSSHHILLFHVSDSGREYERYRVGISIICI